MQNKWLKEHPNSLGTGNGGESFLKTLASIESKIKTEEIGKAVGGVHTRRGRRDFGVDQRGRGGGTTRERAKKLQGGEQKVSRETGEFLGLRNGSRKGN